VPPRKTKTINLPAEPPRLPPDPNRLIGSRELRELFGGVSTMSIWRWTHGGEPEFPKPVKIAKRNFWRLGAVLSFITERERASLEADDD
jgi:predicted DNA-binding transcriptional regulator AlpA